MTTAASSWPKPILPDSPLASPSHSLPENFLHHGMPCAGVGSDLVRDLMLRVPQLLAAGLQQV